MLDTHTSVRAVQADNKRIKKKKRQETESKQKAKITNENNKDTSRACLTHSHTYADDTGARANCQFTLSTQKHIRTGQNDFTKTRSA